MSLAALMFNLRASASDKKRDAAIALPEGVTQCRDISYGPHGKANLLDVYYPQGADGPLPTIVSIHGGGYVYGSKEIYRRYGMDMARRGFGFVNFNYRLAPKWKFPAPLADTAAALDWVARNGRRFRLDPERIILVGDSAGAQLASQYAAIHTNPGYAALFRLKQPAVKIRALGLHCGFYDVPNRAACLSRGLLRDYLGSEAALADPRVDVLGAVTDRYPPAFVATACHDFLREEAEPMADFLTARGLTAEYRCYGSREDPRAGHVFHVNIALPEAQQCNGDAAAFFRKYV